MWHYKLALLIVACYMAMDVLATPQQVIFHKGAACTEETLNISDTTDSLNETWVGLNALSLRIIGMWKIHSRNLLNGSSTWFFDFYASPPYGVCRSTIQPNWEYTKAERIGPDDLTTPQITFFTEQHFNGVKYDVTEDQDAIASEPIVVLSFATYSNSSWVLYEGLNYTGYAQCLRRREYDDFSSYSIHNGTVGSVREPTRDDPCI